MESQAVLLCVDLLRRGGQTTKQLWDVVKSLGNPQRNSSLKKRNGWEGLGHILIGARHIACTPLLSLCRVERPSGQKEHHWPIDSSPSRLCVCTAAIHQMDHEWLPSQITNIPAVIKEYVYIHLRHILYTETRDSRTLQAKMLPKMFLIKKKKHLKMLCNFSANRSIMLYTTTIYSAWLLFIVSDI